jgi:hypothetical protein
MLTSITRSRTLWVALGCGALVYALLPPGITLMNDDFGYIGSVVETLRRGRPWTDEWLEPWSASLAGLSALLFTLTGSAQAAVFGLQGLAAAAMGAALFLLIRVRGLRPAIAAGLVAVVLTFPTVLWKSLEFTSVIIYLPALLWAIWAVERRSWIVFLGVWALALASRQSAIVWGAIPLWHSAVAVRRRLPFREHVAAPALAVAAGGVVFLVLLLGMNRTHSQSVIANQPWPSLEWTTSLHHAVFGAGIWLIFAGIGALVAALGRHGGAALSWSVARPLAAIGAAAGIFALLSLLRPIYFEHASFDGGQGVVYRNLLIAIGLGGWSTLRFAVRPDFLLAAACSLAAVSQRPDVWDYYYLDIAFLAFFGVLTSPGSEREGAAPRWLAAAAAVVGAVVAGFHGWYSYGQKCRVDRDYAVCVLTETALRHHAIGLNEIGHAPFGFIGWHLHRSYLARDPGTPHEIGGFMRYVEANPIEVRASPRRVWADSRSLRPIDGPDASRVIASGLFPTGWLWTERYSLLRRPDAPVRPAPPNLPTDSRLVRRFPLDAAEWSRCLSGAPD